MIEEVKRRVVKREVISSKVDQQRSKNVMINRVCEWSALYEKIVLI